MAAPSDAPHPPSASGDVAVQILHALAQSDDPSHEILSTETFPALSFAELKAALDRLASRDMVAYDTIERENALLEPEGEQIAAAGSHEARVFEALRAAVDGLTVQELEGAVGDKTVARLGQGKAFKEKWIAKTKDGKFKAATDSIQDVTKQQMQTIQSTRTHPDAKVLSELKKRKLIRFQKIISFRIRRAAKFALEIAREETDLTADMLASGSWKSSVFKPYNFRALGADQHAGALHPLNKVRAEFRHIFFEMGFTEMPTDRFVESGFWNFDALFVPQQHPARDLQDTFYISDPKLADRPRAEREHDEEEVEETEEQKEANQNEEQRREHDQGRGRGRGHPDRRPRTTDYAAYWDNVRAVHETGKFGSIGYRYPWSADEALRLVLRTHTTAVSTAMLHRLASDRSGPGGKPRPARYFSIDRVFRNETVDATHLAEFHQVEGVIADYDLTLGGLMEFMDVFFGKMGLTGLRYKPAYNPYTEPSMEIFSWHAGLGKLVEIGNSGMFRPEMLEAMGLPQDMRVYGWGLSLERPTMIKYAISNIRELLGHKVDIAFIRGNPAVRLDKN